MVLHAYSGLFFEVICLYEREIRSVLRIGYDNLISFLNLWTCSSTCRISCITLASFGMLPSMASVNDRCAFFNDGGTRIPYHDKGSSERNSFLGGLADSSLVSCSVSGGSDDVEGVGMLLVSGLPGPDVVSLSSCCLPVLLTFVSLCSALSLWPFSSSLSSLREITGVY